MTIELSFLHLFLMVLGAIIGANLGIRGIIVLKFILALIFVLIVIPLSIAPEIQSFLIVNLNIHLPGIIIYGLVITFVLLLFKEFGRELSSFLSPEALSPLENRILGLSLGTALGFFAAEFLF
jgi:hypothetical protein